MKGHNLGNEGAKNLSKLSNLANLIISIRNLVSP